MNDNRPPPDLVSALLVIGLVLLGAIALLAAIFL